MTITNAVRAEGLFADSINRSQHNQPSTEVTSPRVNGYSAQAAIAAPDLSSDPEGTDVDFNPKRYLAVTEIRQLLFNCRCDDCSVESFIEHPMSLTPTDEELLVENAARQERAALLPKGRKLAPINALEIARLDTGFARAQALHRSGVNLECRAIRRLIGEHRPILFYGEILPDLKLYDHREAAKAAKKKPGRFSGPAKG